MKACSLIAVLFVATLALGQGNPQLSQRGQNDNATYNNIVREVRHEIRMQPYYSIFDDISFKVNGTSVQLLGQVVNPTLKSDVENAVKKIEGVTSVDDQIEVLPPSPMDDRIRLATARTLANTPQLSKYFWSALPSIHIIVKSGHVRLTGVVDNDADKNIAGMKANGMPGTLGQVQNDLRVVGRRTESDE